jgi:hypothetical protein
MLEGTVHVAPVPNLDDDHHELLITDLVHDPILALPQSVAVIARELLTTGRSRVLGQALNALDNSLSVLLGADGQ